MSIETSRRLELKRLRDQLTISMQSLYELAKTRSPAGSGNLFIAIEHLNHAIAELDQKLNL